MPEVQTYVVTETRSVVVIGATSPSEALEVARRGFELEEKVQMGECHGVPYGYTTGLPVTNSVEINRE